MSETTAQAQTIICEEVFDESSLPSEEEIIEYAKKIGIDPQCEPHLLPIALQGLMQPLPDGWKPCFDSTLNRWYYYNKETKQSQWEHPLDSVYRNVVKRGRSEGYSSAAEDDSKCTGKEELRSLEEISDLLLSSDIKPEEASDMNENDKLKLGHQPLLLRRKQMQSGGDSAPLSLVVAKMINNTMRESNLSDLNDMNKTSREPLSLKSTGLPDNLRPSHSVPMTPKQMLPLRRAQTLDPIPNVTSKSAAPPIKGILRESSFTGLPSRNLNKLSVAPGDSGKIEAEDDKRRSVRFADPERKALDIRVKFSDSDAESADEDGDESKSSSQGDEGCKSPSKTEKFNIDPQNLEIVSQKLNALHMNKMKEKLINTQPTGPLDVSNLDFPTDESDDSNGASTSKSGFAFGKEEKTGRFMVSKSVIDVTKSGPVANGGERGEAAAGDNKLQSFEVEEIAKVKTAERMSQLEEKLTKEIHDKVAILKKQQNDTLSRLSENLNIELEVEKTKLYEEHSAQIAQFKLNLQNELKLEEEALRNDHKRELDELMKRLEDERKSCLTAAEVHHKSILNSVKQEEKDKFELEKSKLGDEFSHQLKSLQQKYDEEIRKFKSEEESKFSQVKSKHSQQMKEICDQHLALKQEAEVKFRNEMAAVTSEHNAKVSELKVQKEAELRRVQTEWEDKITAASLQHTSVLESAMDDHEKSMALLRQTFQKEEEELRKGHAMQVESWNVRLKTLLEKEPNASALNRDFEKMRCEKRLIEDKYRSLKDKYVQLKTDMKVAVERKLQSRARRKREELLAGIDKEFIPKTSVLKNKSEKNKNNNNPDVDPPIEEKPERKCPRINIEPLTLKEFHQRELNENDPSSDDQYTSLSLTLPNDEQKSLSLSPVRAEPNRRRKSSQKRLKLEPGEGQGVLEDVRSQLQELEEIEERIPANSQGETYLRYPFQSPGLSTSAEVDFYRHRVIVEQEAVRAARECLLQQKRELEARQNILRTNNNTSTMQQLQQQERDLTEMEVSLHRTRSLLGEKMIRLRLLGQTLNRLVDDSPSSAQNAILANEDRSPGVAGFQVETLPFNVLQNLENINSEIREIWSQLSKQQSEGTMGNEVLRAKSPIRSRAPRRIPSNRAEIEARIQSLRDWLQKPPSRNIDWNQLTL